MMEETKNVIYMSLDLLDSISKTSETKAKFINIDEDTLKKVREELFDLLRERSNIQVEKKHNTPKAICSTEKNVNKKREIIGLLPSILIDKEKFPKNIDIVKLAEESLNLEIPSYKKKSRDEIIGILIAMIATKEDHELDLFFKAWTEFTQNESNCIEKVENIPTDKEKSVQKRDFVDVWLSFYNNYKV